MDANDGSVHSSARLPASSPGGAVEPANRATIAKNRFQTPLEVPAERYELRDPFAEAVYRANNFLEIVAKADQLGSTRFTAIDEKDMRTTVQKVGDTWQRGPQHASAPERAADPVLANDEIPQSAKVA